MSVLLAIALVLSAEAATAPSAPLVVSSDGGPVVSSTVLEDPPFGPALVGAVLLVERRDGVFVQGDVEEASPEHIRIATDEIRSGDAKKIRTLAPAGTLLRPGMEVRVQTAAGTTLRGRVLEIVGRQVAILVAEGTARLRWIDMTRVDVLSLAAPFVSASPTPAPVTPGLTADSADLNAIFGSGKPAGGVNDDIGPAGPATRYTVKLKDGSSLRGELVEKTGDALRVKTAFGPATIPLEKIDRVEMDLEALAAPAESQPAIPDITTLGLTAVPRFQPQPVYPALAREANLQGSVRLQIVVDEFGHVTSARVVRSQPPFDEPALAAVRRWTYEPLFLNGRPRAWKSAVSLNFRLRDGETAARTVAAPARRFGAAGSWEAGGGVGYASAKRHENFQGSTFDASGSDLFVSPFGGYFAADGLELSTGITLEIQGSDFFDGSGRSDGYFAAFASGGYYFEAGDSARIGPEITLRLSKDDVVDDAADGTSTKITEEGPGFVVSVLAKAPLTKGCLLTGGIGWYRDNRNISARQGAAEGRGSSVVTGVQTTLRFSVWF